MTHADVRIIDDLATLRLLAQPLRLQILEALRRAGEPWTVKQLAAALAVPQTRLYHHVNLLAEHGLIRVAATRLVSGITEKRYAVSAYRFSVAKTLLAPNATAAGAGALEVLLSVILDEVRSEITRGAQAGLIDLTRFQDDQIAPRQLVIGRRWARLTTEQLGIINARVHDLWAGIDSRLDPARAPGDPATPLYELLIACYPTLPPGTMNVGSHSPPPE